MINPANMMSAASLPPGFFQAGLKAAQMPPGLARKAENLPALKLSPQDARSFSSQLIVEQYSLSISIRVQTIAPPQQADQTSPLDFSAEATAKRIFDFSISLFDVYQAQNPDEPAGSALAEFEQLVRDAIEEGFGKARGILEDLGKLDEPTAKFVDETYSTLQSLLDEFFAHAAEGETGEKQSDGAPLDSLWQTFELEYRYLSYESLSTSHDTEAGALSAEYTRLQYESLRMSMSYGEPLPESSLQYTA